MNPPGERTGRRHWRASQIVLAVGVVLAGGVGFYVKTHPLVFNESFFSHAHCIKVTGLALSGYASEHAGAFPVHTNGYGDALLVLNNWAVGIVRTLGGPGYSDDAFREAANTGGDVDERRCGRVYVQGLREGMDDRLAIFFDKLPTPGGDHCHLWHRLRAPLGREVWTLGGGNSFVTVRDWPAFASNQVSLLIEAGIHRAGAERLYNDELQPNHQPTD